ncbi:hypothetical protein EPN44_00990 [bacterium]|nr:MAG: hypothetical protein EPN44_00990 [bacterium]
MVANLTEISHASLESFAHQQSDRLHRARVDAFDAAVRACLTGGVQAAEETLHRVWERNPVHSGDEDAADRARFLRALQWMEHDECLRPADILTCEPFALERSLPTGECYVLQGRIDALSRERGTLYVWASSDPKGALIPAAYAMNALRSRRLRLTRIFFDVASAYPVVTGDITSDEVEAQMREIDRLAAQWIAQFDSAPSTLSFSRTTEYCRNSVFQGWGPRLG